MSKRPFVCCVVSYVIGIVGAGCPPPVRWGAAALILAAVLLIREYYPKRSRKRHYAAVILLTGFYVAGIWRMESEQAFRAAYLPILNKTNVVSLQGRIAAKEKQNDQYQLRLENVILKDGDQVCQTNQTLIRLDKDEYPIGITITATGRVRRLHTAVNDGGFDERTYYQNKKIDYRFDAEKITGCYGRKNSIKEGLYRMRSRLKEVLEQTAGEQAGVLAVMLLGDKELLKKETKKLYQRAGISHILVISGLHISMLGMGLFRLLRLFGRGIYSSACLSLLLLLCYGAMTGGGASTVRAITMFALLMGSKCLGRSYDRLTALAAAVLFLLWDNAFLLADSGFLFSVLAVLGVIVAGEKANGLQVNLWIQLMTLPLAASCYYEVFLLSVPVNLWILPLAPCVVFAGLMGSAAGMLHTTAASFILMLPRTVLRFYETVAAWASGLSWATCVTGKPYGMAVVLYYLLACFFLLWRRKRKCGIGKRLCVSAAMAACCAVLLLFRVRTGTRIDFLDVGQGDGICIQERGGSNLFIDGGSSSEKNIGTYRIEPYLKYHGISRVDYWFVSHADSDHISGLSELLENGYPIGHLVVASAGEKSDALQELKELAVKRGVSLMVMKAGETISMEYGSIRCLFPDASYPGEGGNERSMVIVYREQEFRALFAGDITENEESYLNQKGRLMRVDIYKAAHHGSKYSSSKELLDVILPKLTVISYGEDNRYGHPHPETLKRLRESDSRIMGTAECGEITVKLTGHGAVSVSRYSE